MMLTPEQLAELRAAIQDDERKFQGAYVTYPVSLKFMQDMMETFDAQQARIAELEQDAARYRWLLQQAWFQEAFDRFDPDDGGMQDRFEKCVAEIADTAMQSAWPEDASDYGSRIAVIGKNGNDGLHYPEGKP